MYADLIEIIAESDMFLFLVGFIANISVHLKLIEIEHLSFADGCALILFIAVFFLVRFLCENAKPLIKNNIKLIKFLLVGVLNTLFGYSIFALIIWLNYHYSFAAACSTILGVLFNYKTTGYLVFGMYGNSRIIPFLAVYGVVYSLNVSSLAVLAHYGINAYLGGIILILPLALVAYYLNSKYVFR